MCNRAICLHCHLPKIKHRHWWFRIPSYDSEVTIRSTDSVGMPAITSRQSPQMTFPIIPITEACCIWRAYPLCTLCRPGRTHPSAGNTSTASCNGCSRGSSRRSFLTPVCYLRPVCDCHAFQAAVNGLCRVSNAGCRFLHFLCPNPEAMTCLRTFLHDSQSMILPQTFPGLSRQNSHVGGPIMLWPPQWSGHGSQ